MSKRIIVIENDPFLALEYAKMLRQAGNIIIGPFRNLGDAKGVLIGREADGVILDGEDGLDKLIPHEAEVLLQSNIPFFLLLDGARSRLKNPFRSKPSVKRPFTADKLLTAVRNFL